MLLKIIACEVFTREICYCVATAPHVVDLEFTPKGAHTDANVLRRLLQLRIDDANASGKNYDAIVLGLGLCGNSTVGLVSRGAPLVIPRAHDCCTLFMGSKERYSEHFADNPSQAFSSAGYIEHGGDFMREADEFHRQMGFDRTYAEYVEQYGAENAAFIWETLHPVRVEEQRDHRVVYIEVPEFAHLGYADQCREKAEAEGKCFLKLEGNLDLIRKLVHGEWDSKEFLVLKPNEVIAGVYDWDQVLRAAPPDGEEGSP